MTDDEFELLKRLEDINDSLESISSKLGSIALFFWLPLILSLFGGIFFVGLLIVSRG